jgi:hypothetical protein
VLVQDGIEGRDASALFEKDGPAGFMDGAVERAHKNKTPGTPS